MGIGHPGGINKSTLMSMYQHERSKEIHTLWLQYLDAVKADEWNNIGVLGTPDVHRLHRIAEAEYVLIYPGEGVHFEGDG